MRVVPFPVRLPRRRVADRMWPRRPEPFQSARPLILLTGDDDAECSSTSDAPVIAFDVARAFYADENGRIERRRDARIHATSGRIVRSRSSRGCLDGCALPLCAFPVSKLDADGQFRCCDRRDHHATLVCDCTLSEVRERSAVTKRGCFRVSVARERCTPWRERPPTPHRRCVRESFDIPRVRGRLRRLRKCAPVWGVRLRLRGKEGLSGLSTVCVRPRFGYSARVNVPLRRGGSKSGWN